METSISIKSWNIQSRDGLTGNKLQELKFTDLITSSDIFCLQENRKTIKLPGYVCYNNLRKNSTGGGVAIGYSRRLLGGIKRYDIGKRTDILAITLDKSFFNLKRDRLLINCYIPPSNSSYIKRHNREPFNDLTTLLEEVDNRFDITICGDFNSRCQNIVDANLCTEIPGVISGNDIDDDCSYPQLERNNKDKSHNSYTKIFMELIAQSNLSIQNGRTLGDMFGEFTHVGYNGASTVDYFLTSDPLTSQNFTLKVEQLTEYSDHKPLLLTLLNKGMHIPKLKDLHHDEAPEQFKWTNDSKDMFIGAQCSSDIQDQITALTCISTMDHNDVINLNQKTIDIIHQVADMSLVKKKKTNSNFKNKNKWFDKECRQAKRLMNASLRHLNRNDKDTRARVGYYQARKEYRAKIDKKKGIFNASMNEEIETLNKKNINWAALKRLQSLKKEETPFDEFDLEAFFNFFKNLYSVVSPINPDERSHLLKESTLENARLIEDMSSSLQTLNREISMDELLNTRNQLSNGKSVSLDLINNEMLKNLQYPLLKLILKLFNSCLVQGSYPWNVSTITPIPKGGDPYDPDNYRAIALGSCIGKLFSSILLRRINNFRTDTCPDPPNQLGFKKGAQTGDHIFTLKTVIEKYTRAPRSHLYTCFVDFRKAFDSVAREALLYKVAKIGIGGNIFSTLKNMYENTSTRIKLIGKLSDHIKLDNGVEQGHPLSPELFKIFIYDLSVLLNEITESIPELNTVRLNHLFWADDLVLLSLNEKTLQRLVNILEKYCDSWGLTVNLKKTKLLIFNKAGRKIFPKQNIILNQRPIEVVNSYCYLGIVFTPSGKFKTAIDELKKKATRAFFKLRAIVSRHNLSANTLFKLFDALISPILTYGSQIFFPETKFSNAITKKSSSTSTSSWKQHWLSQIALDPFESIHLSFIKWVLGIHKKATNLACWSEVGRPPLGIKITTQFYEYCIRATLAPDSSLLFHTMKEQQANDLKLFQKFQQLNITFSTNPKSNLETETAPSRTLKKGLMTMFTAIWDGALTQSRKLNVLRSIKDKWEPEYYIQSLPLHLRQNITRLRTSAHRLPIETGRYERPVIPQNERFCTVCTNTGILGSAHPNKVVGDEQHLIFHCPIGAEERSKLKGKLKEAVDSHDISALFNLKSPDLTNLGLFINSIYSSYISKSPP